MKFVMDASVAQRSLFSSLIQTNGGVVSYVLTREASLFLYQDKVHPTRYSVLTPPDTPH